MNKKWIALPAALACAATLLLGCSRTPEADPTTAALTEIVKKDEQYTDWLKIECVQFVVEAQNEQQTDIAMHEKNGEGCSGDQDASQVIDRFRINKSTGVISRYDVIENSYQPVGQLHQ